MKEEEEKFHVLDQMDSPNVHTAKLKSENGQKVGSVLVKAPQDHLLPPLPQNCTKIQVPEW